MHVVKHYKWTHPHTHKRRRGGGRETQRSRTLPARVCLWAARFEVVDDVILGEDVVEACVWARCGVLAFFWSFIDGGVEHSSKGDSILNLLLLRVPSPPLYGIVPPAQLVFIVDPLHSILTRWNTYLKVFHFLRSSSWKGKVKNKMK